VACGSAQEALELCITTAPNIILLDVVMPEMDGYEALKRLKKIIPEVPVISKWSRPAGQ
jgi:CheY-like chemotaxis protein